MSDGAEIIRAEIVVRDARQDDRAAIRDLTLGAYGEYAQTMTPAAWAGLEGAVRGALAAPERAQGVVAERDGKVIGSVLLFPPEVDAYGDLAGRMAWPEVRLLAVAPDARGQGVARLLMAECVRRARESGASGLGLHTSQSMTTAMRMYARMGFARTPEYDFQPPGAELVQAYCLPLGAMGES